MTANPPAMDQGRTTDASYRGPFITVTSLFFIWGFITVLVDAFIPRLKDVFELTYLQAGLVQLAWFTAYGLLSVPGGRLIARIGYKRGILVGLGMASIGCLLFYPAAATRQYPLFLLALFVVAGGITILQVAANPYISILGDPRGASARLNLAQAFNSLGTTIAPVIAASFLLSDKILPADAIASLSDSERATYYAAEASAVQGPFLALGLAFLALALAIAFAQLPRILAAHSGTWAEYRQALADRKLLFGAVGIFVYVGAEVALGSYMVNYGLTLAVDDQIASSRPLQVLAGLAATLKGKELSAMDPKGVVGALLTFYWGGAMVGRFIGSFLMRRAAPHRLLGGFAAGAMLMIGLSVASAGVPALLALLAVGLFNSIMFPTIFTLAIEDLGELTPLGSGVLCTAIVGGAVIPPAVGLLADHFGFATAFLLPLACYLFILVFALVIVPSASRAVGSRVH